MRGQSLTAAIAEFCPATASKSVLILEPDPALRRTYASLVERSLPGVPTATAACAADAAALLRQLTPGLVILEPALDDCDGLELLGFHLLLDLGFAADEVYRSIVVRPSDGQHHMVTLWFEDPADPWVIDPTGAMTAGMPRMSEVPGWIPLKLFTESEEFTVHSSEQARAAALAVPAASRAVSDPR